MIPTWILDKFGIINQSPVDFPPIYINGMGEIVEIMDPERFLRRFMTTYAVDDDISATDMQLLEWKYFLIIFNKQGFLSNPYMKYDDYMLSDKYFYYLMVFNDYMIDSMLPTTKDMAKSLHKIGMKMDYLKTDGDLIEMFDEINCTGDEEILQHVDFSLISFREENDVNLPF